MTTANHDEPTSRIKASGIVSEDAIRDALERLRESNTPITERNILADLVGQGEISRWQAHSIQQYGKYKGFIYRNYMFLKVYPPSANGDRMAEALNRSTREFALVRVVRHEDSFEVEFLMPLSADSSGSFPILSADAQLRRGT